MEQIETGNRLTIEFWGVRGSIPTAEKDKLDVGGNTPCIVIQFNQEPYLVIDGGTGLRVFGTKMCENSPDMMKASILFSHFHWDHIQGVPFFGPIYSKNADLKFYSTLPAKDLKRILEDQMKAPYFPVALSYAPSRREYGQVPESGCDIGSLRVRPVPLNHPGGAFGYRIDSSAGSVIYVSDHEHGREDMDARIADHAKGADLLIYDAQYTPSEYLQHIGWGHSTWLEGTRLANRAGVGRLVLYHHNPFRLDQEAVEILIEARKEFAGTELARENLSIVLSTDMRPVEASQTLR